MSSADLENVQNLENILEEIKRQTTSYCCHKYYTVVCHNHQRQAELRDLTVLDYHKYINMTSWLFHFAS